MMMTHQHCPHPPKNMNSVQETHHLCIVFLCTPWPIHEDHNANDTEKYEWSASTPTISNDSETYNALPRQVDDMNNYKNRVRNEVQCLAVALAELQSSVTH